MRPVARFNPADGVRVDDCLSNHHDAPEAGHDTGAPLSAVTPELSFWDHLGATRAQEYAQEDILPGVAFPTPQPDAGAGAAHGQQQGLQPLEMPEQVFASLDDTLRAQELPFETGAPQGLWPDAPGDIDMLGGDDRPTGLGPRDDMPSSAPDLAVPPVRHSLRRKPRAPSRLSYRTQRIWLTPLYRRAIKIGVPVVAALAMLGVSVGNEDRRASLLAQAEAAYSAVVDRPEFMVTRLELSPTAPVLADAISALLADDLPLSSWRIDLEEMRARVEALDAVRVADLRVTAEGSLSVSVTERVPAVLWRSPEGLEVLDAEGIRIGFAPDRHVRPDLPIIAGLGASAHVAEALALIDAAAPLGERLRGLVRQGERRWDVVLGRNQRIKLPERGAVTALERVIALDHAQDLLARDLLVADLRNPARPTLQIGTGAMETIRAIRAQN